MVFDNGLPKFKSPRGTDGILSFCRDTICLVELVQRRVCPAFGLIESCHALRIARFSLGWLVSALASARRGRRLFVHLVAAVALLPP